MSKKFMVNGIEVVAISVGNGMYAAVPTDPIGLIMGVLSGRISAEELHKKINSLLTGRDLEIVPVQDGPADPNADECDDCDGDCDCDECEDYDLDAAYDEGFNAGVEEGYSDGYEIGYEEGYNKGLSESPDPESPVESGPKETLQQWREREGMSRTQMAEYLGISRRSLGRYEDTGRLAAEFNL